MKFSSIFSLACLSLAAAVPTKRSPVYFGLSLPTRDILTDLDNSFSSNVPAFFQKLQSTHRVQSSFHVTLIHVTASKSHSDIWNYYKDLVAKGGVTQVPVQLNHIVWDDRLMAVDVTVDPEGTSGIQWPSTNDVTHATIGTVNKSVKPVESNDLLVQWKSDGSVIGINDSGVSAIAMQNVRVVGTLTAF
ncbi:hypothetical protein AA313_de0209830 [Arthrobotrys entomopaga]|nr:hypothetical protein AA313_de0209830 [Arthrobotrys entomopaga]